MNDPTPSPAPKPADATPRKAANDTTIFIRLWPKTPLFYPLAIISLVCGLLSPHDPTAEMTHVLAMVFLSTLAFTLFISTMDIGLTWALLGVAATIIVALTSFIIEIYHPFLKDVLPFLSSFRPAANNSFYYSVFLMWLFLMAIAFLYSRFHYVRVEPNEVVVVGGLLDKRKRYPTLGLRYTKEVVDVFEYYLPFVNSGRLILRFNEEDEPLVMDHVINVENTIKRMERITGVMRISETPRP